MIPDFSGEYISADSVRDGDVIEIIGEGKEEFSKALNKVCFDIPIRLGEKAKKWTPSNKHGKLLQQTFGEDTKNWIGKKVELVVIEGKLLIKPIVVKTEKLQ